MNNPEKRWMYGEDEYPRRTPAIFDCCPGRKKHHLRWICGAGSIAECFWECLFCHRTFSIACIERFEPVWASTVIRTMGEIDPPPPGRGRELPAHPLPLDPAGRVSLDPKSETSPAVHSSGNHTQGIS